MKEDEINLEFRDIISHALLGSDTSDISKETWELLLNECTRFAMSHAKQISISFAEWIELNCYGMSEANKERLEINNKGEWYYLDDKQIYTTKQIFEMYLIDTEENN